MRSLLLFAACCAWAIGARAQELFVYTDPASNTPAHAVGLRLSSSMLERSSGHSKDFLLTPEVVWGVNKKLMLKADGYILRRDAQPSAWHADGGSLSAKYRFYSNDEMKRHFRMAAFGRAAINKGNLYDGEIALGSQNTGVELGLVGTQLLHKTALSATASWLYALENVGSEQSGTGADPRSGLGFSLSAGQLILPKTYTSYKQMNLNVMVELLGQYQPGSNAYYIDAAPSVQFIFISQTQVNIGYRRQVTGDMDRMWKGGLLVRIEHLLFNAL